MSCPLCQQRRARRACPALGHQICPVCCGTKRQVEIQCPSDCAYLATAREHPAATVLRQRQRDLGFVVPLLRDFNERQSQVFLLVATFLVQYSPPDFHRLIDDDVAQAAGALAATYETATSGLIYDHRPSSLPAERLMNALRPTLAEAGKSGGTPFERDTAVVLRRVEQAVREAGSSDPENRRAFIEMLARVVRKPEEGAFSGPAGGPASGSEAPNQEPPRLIVP